MGFIERSIHGRILVRLADSYAWRDEWLALLRDVPAEDSASAGGAPFTVEVAGRDGLDLRSAREVMDRIHITPTSVIDTLYGVEVEWRGANTLSLQCSLPALEWAMPSLLLAGLQSGCAFMHGAGLERDGIAWLFPSWGGIGKTALVATLVRSHGWRMLGDDFVILDGDGRCFAFPKPMSLYPYHRPLFPEVFSAGRGPAAPVALNSALSGAAVKLKPLLRRFPGALQWARRNNPQSVRVSPSEVFGPERLGTVGVLGGAVFLERVAGLASPQLEDGATGVAGRIFGTTISEYDARCMLLCNIAVGSGHLRPEQFYLPWMQLLENGLRDRPQYVLRLPADWPVERVAECVLERLGTRMAGAGVV